MKYRFLSVFLILLAVLCVFSQETQLKRLSDSTPVNMVLVEGGRYIMGSRNGESNEEPIHVVTVDSFYMSKYEVTQKEWQGVMGNNPSYFEGDTLPVESVSWYEAIVFCNTLSIKENLTPCYSIGAKTNPTDWGSMPTEDNDTRWDTIRMNITANGYRLPTEAEWEYAARGGKHKEGYEYSGSNNLDSVGWYWQNSGDKWLSGTDDDWDYDKIVANNGRTWSVGAKAPNALDLYDMSGNVYEWCWDWYDRYSSGSQTNPTGSTGGSYRVSRGGCWYYFASFCRVSYRATIRRVFATAIWASVLCVPYSPEGRDCRKDSLSRTVTLQRFERGARVRLRKAV